jgi:hypothetical protein
VKKTIYTLNIGNFAPKISAMTLPLMQRYAKKIGADFHMITERKFPDYPVVYEKFQVYDLAQQHGNDWNFYWDLDALIHPDFYDPTLLVGKDVTISNGTDFTPQRFKPDKYFLRDGRYTGKGNWCAIFSDWCLDYYHPLDDLTFDEAVANITPTVQELGTVITPAHLIDDYVVSRNIARYGLKHVLIPQLAAQRGLPHLLWHHYLMPPDRKVVLMQKELMSWAAKVLEYSLNPNDVNILNSWNGTPSLTDFLSTVAHGKEIVDIIHSWGVQL